MGHDFFTYITIHEYLKYIKYVFLIFEGYITWYIIECHSFEQRELEKPKSKISKYKHKHEQYYMSKCKSNKLHE